MNSLKRETGVLVALLFAAALAACDAADGVEVQPLPPLERPTPEARAGLPEIAGVWRFAGWEVRSEEVAAELGEPGAPGDLILETQRLDSLAGYWSRGDVRLPVVGEVRRDGIVALVVEARDTAAAGFVAGYVAGDTLWIELSTLQTGQTLHPAARWAFHRGAVGQAFLRLPTGVLLRDTVMAMPDTAAIAAGPAVPRPPATERADGAPRPAAADEPAGEAPRTQPAERRPAEARPAEPRPDTPAREPPPAARDTAAAQQPAPDTTPRPQPPPGPRVDIPPRRR